MYQQCIIAQFADTQKARLGLEVLAKAGFDETHVSFVSRHDDPALAGILKLEQAEETRAVGSGTAAGIGGLLGGALAAPVAASTLLGPFLLVGPLVGVGVGAALGGMLGGAQWGVPHEAGETYETAVRDGAVLVIVTGDKSELYEAEASLKTAGPESIRRYANLDTDPSE